MNSSILELETNGVVCFPLSTLSMVKLSPFEKIKNDFPDSVFTKPVDEVEYKITSEDVANLMGLERELGQLLQDVFPGIYIKYHFLGYGVNADINPWHNDHCSAFAGHMATVNCFFDAADADGGGSFQIKHIGRDRVTTISPKQFDVVIFNQGPNWQHRVIPTNSVRRMISFAALIPNVTE